MMGCCLLDGSSRGGLWPRFTPLFALNHTTFSKADLARQFSRDGPRDTRHEGQGRLLNDWGICHLVGI